MPYMIKMTQKKYSIVLICITLFLLIRFGEIDLTRLFPKTAHQQEKLSSPQLSPVSIIIPSFAPTPTLAPNQKAIYTFYMQTTIHQTSPKGLILHQSDTGKVYTVDIGTVIFIGFGGDNYRISSSSPQGIFEVPKGEVHLPANAMGLFRVIRVGFGTITVTEEE